MNNWHTEFMAEMQRQHILEERGQIRLEELVLPSPGSRPSLFGRTMFHLANWMISTGSQLRKRYEAPVPPCSTPPTSSLAG